MVRLSEKEVVILRFIRRSRHKTTAAEIALGLHISRNEVEAFVQGMVNRKLLNVARGTPPYEDAYYTNPEMREEIFALIG